MWTGKTELQTLMLIAIKDGRTPYLMDRTNRITDVNDDIYDIYSGWTPKKVEGTNRITDICTNKYYIQDDSS